jgi:hypothetical protein
MADICVLNSFIVYNEGRQPQDKLLLRKYREDLCTELVGGRTYRKQIEVVAPLDDNKRRDHTLKHAPLKMNTSVTCKVHFQRVETIYLQRVQSKDVPRSMLLQISLSGQLSIR